MKKNKKIYHVIFYNIDSIELNYFTGICNYIMETDITKVFLNRPKNYNNITP